MPSYHCHKLETSLHFLPRDIKFCCSCAEGPGIAIKDYNKINKKDIENVKSKYIKALRKGQIPRQCQGCTEYEEIHNEPEKNLFASLFKKEEPHPVSYLIVDNFTQCNCNCIYCSQKILYNGKETNYSLLPLIKQLYENNMIDKNSLKVEFQGGDISCLNEFNLLLEEFKKNNCTKYAIHTNSIKYMPQLETLNDTPESFICISLDCGTKDTFNKIKNVDAFEQTVENIKKLRDNSNINLNLKYIIIKGVNDNLDELKNFLNLSKELIKKGAVILDIDYRDTIMNHSYKFTAPSHYKELFHYAETFCKENNINYTISDLTKNILSQSENN